MNGGWWLGRLDTIDSNNFLAGYIIDIIILVLKGFQSIRTKQNIAIFYRRIKAS